MYGGFLAKWSGSAWDDLLSGHSDQHVNSLAIDGSGNLYSGESEGFSQWDTSSNAVLSTQGSDDAVQALAVDPYGNVFAGGWFAYIGGKDRPHFAKWMPAFLQWF